MGPKWGDNLNCFNHLGEIMSFSFNHLGEIGIQSYHINHINYLGLSQKIEESAPDLCQFHRENDVSEHQI